jgi:hypothetical protein
VRKGEVMLRQRLCDDPKAILDGETSGSTGKNGCPDLWELEDGSFLVVGTDRTDEFRHLVGKDLYLDETESIVVVPRRTLVSARERIPTE